MGLVDELLAGSQRALARLATLVENDDPVGLTAIERLYPRTGGAHVVGVTGPPGAGKSTLVNALIGEQRSRGRRVGVLAVDPTSPLSGGAALGDRIRMLERQVDDGVFIRSMASRGRVGGLAPKTSSLVHLLDAAGYDDVLIETVGVGQEETEVARHVHTLVLVQTPGTGDAVQTMKAGILEFAEVIAVNKADREGSDELLRELRAALSLAAHDEGAWLPRIVPCVATAGRGVDRLAEAIAAHWAHLAAEHRLDDRRRRIARADVLAQLQATIAKRVLDPIKGSATVAAVVEEVADRRVAPEKGAERILAEWSGRG